MRDQDRAQASAKRPRSSKSSKQNGIQIPTLQRPTNENKETWIAYWKAQGQPWRWEPEIDAERQRYLKELITSAPIYPGPFYNIALSRADVEWLIANTASEQRLNLHGANLRNTPLQCMNLQGTILHQAHLEEADLSKAHLEGAVLAEAYLENANLNNAYLMGANLYKAHLEGASIAVVDLESSLLIEARLEGATLYKTHLEKSLISKAHLEGASLVEAHLEGADLHLAHLEGCILNGAFFDSATNLRNIFLANKTFGTAFLAGIHWSDADSLS